MHYIALLITVCLTALHVFVMTSPCSAKACSLLCNKLHGNSTALFARDFSIINEPYVRCSLQLTKHTITHSTGSAPCLSGLFVFSAVLSTLWAFATCTARAGAHKLTKLFTSITRQPWRVLTPNCLQCMSIYYVFVLPQELDCKADVSD